MKWQKQSQKLENERSKIRIRWAVTTDHHRNVAGTFNIVDYTAAERRTILWGRFISFWSRRGIMGIISDRWTTNSCIKLASLSQRETTIRLWRDDDFSCNVDHLSGRHSGTVYQRSNDDQVVCDRRQRPSAHRWPSCRHCEQINAEEIRGAYRQETHVQAQQ